MKSSYEIEAVIDICLNDARQKIMDDLFPDDKHTPQKLQAHCHFPIEWAGKEDGNDPERTDGFHGPMVTDPYIFHTFYWDADILDDPMEYHEVNLKDAIESMIDLFELGEGGPIDPDDHWKLKAVSAALKDLAGQLDAALERE